MMECDGSYIYIALCEGHSLNLSSIARHPHQLAVFRLALYGVYNRLCLVLVVCLGHQVSSRQGLNDAREYLQKKYTWRLSEKKNPWWKRLHLVLAYSGSGIQWAGSGSHRYGFSSQV